MLTGEQGSRIAQATKASIFWCLVFVWLISTTRFRCAVLPLPKYCKSLRNHGLSSERCRRPSFEWWSCQWRRGSESSFVPRFPLARGVYLLALRLDHTHGLTECRDSLHFSDMWGVPPPATRPVKCTKMATSGFIYVQISHRAPILPNFGLSA